MYKVCKDGWILGQTYGRQTKGYQESSLRGAKNYYSCPNGTYFKWEKCGCGKDVKNVKSSLPSTSI